MKELSDLTRWNRASLDRFRYIDGNAVTFLEDLRQALLDRFSDPDNSVLKWSDLVPVRTGDSDDAYVRMEREQARLINESARERLNRLKAQYEVERRDWGWELIRVLARSSHILTEYIDAYANEGYLRTATQWDNVRRLVEMLDYHPAPPASASTRLVIEAKENMSGILETGFQVRYSPPDGGAPVVFETLEDLELNYGLNRLRPAEYNRNPDKLNGSQLLLDCKIKNLNIGDPVILEDEKTGILRAHLIQGLTLIDDLTQISVTPRLSKRLIKGYTKVHLVPRDRLSPKGPSAKGAEVEKVLRLTETAKGLQPGMIIYITDGVERYYRRIRFMREHRLVLDKDVGILRLDRSVVSKPVHINISKQAADPNPTADGSMVIYAYSVAGDWSRLSGAVLSDKQVDQHGRMHLPTYRVTGVRYHPADGTSEPKGYTVLTLAWDKKDHNFPLKNPQTLLAPPATPGPWQVDTYIEKINGRLPDTITAGKPKKTSTGDLAAAVSGLQMSWARLDSVTVDNEKNKVFLKAQDKWFDRGGGDYFLNETLIYTGFKETVRLKNWQMNKTSFSGRRIPLTSVPDALKKGRSLMIENSEKPSDAFFTAVAGIDSSKNIKELILSSDIPEGFNYSNMLIAGNVVYAGHGETGDEKVLGSGSAALNSQTFIFDKKEISFVSDATQPSGVRAAIDILAAGRRWEQVSGFQDSRPTDFHYTVRMTEDASLKISFGDGRRGRRLPTGSNNIRITFRKGVGLSGNLPSGCLSKPVRPHHMVEKVRQPVASTGGNDMEGINSLRENAPATLLTLERAVSLSDFSYLAMSQSSVWQARAFLRPTGFGRNQKVEVVVVPAGGGELGNLGTSLTGFLMGHALPGIELTVTPYDESTFSLDVTLTVNTEQFIPEDVDAAVEKSLKEAFCLKKRALGQDLFLSEVYAVIESVTGVEHSSAVINGNKSLPRIKAEDRQVIILGNLLVDFEGSGTLKDTEIQTVQETVKKTVPLAAYRPVEFIQGIGSRFGHILRSHNVRTLYDLSNLHETKIPGLTEVRLSEFRAKASIIIDL